MARSNLHLVARTCCTFSSGPPKIGIFKNPMDPFKGVPHHVTYYRKVSPTGRNACNQFAEFLAISYKDISNLKRVARSTCRVSIINILVKTSHLHKQINKLLCNNFTKIPSTSNSTSVYVVTHVFCGSFGLVCRETGLLLVDLNHVNSLANSRTFPDSFSQSVTVVSI